MTQAMKISDAKAAVDKEWQKLETIPAWDLEKESKSKKEGFLEAQEDKKKVHFATLMDTINRAPGRHFKGRLFSLRSLHCKNRLRPR